VDTWDAREGVTDDASLRGRPLAGFSMSLSYSAALHDLSRSTKLFLLFTFLMEICRKERNQTWPLAGKLNVAAKFLAARIPCLISYFSIFGILLDTGEDKKIESIQIRPLVIVQLHKRSGVVPLPVVGRPGICQTQRRMVEAFTRSKRARSFGQLPSICIISQFLKEEERFACI
jgi:hypothetical protein